MQNTSEYQGPAGSDGSPGSGKRRAGEGLGCPACGDPRIARSEDIPDHEYALSYVATYAHCAACGTAFQRPMPAESQLGAFYPSSYHSMTAGGLLMDARRAMRVKRLSKLLGGESGLVLDYGCGNGSFLVTAARRLPQNRYLGFEYAEKRERLSLADGNVTIVRGTLADLLPELAPVRVLIMNHVIEHLPDPGHVLRSLSPYLVPGTLFDGQTPNADSLEHRLFGRRWSGYHAPRHTVVFSRAGLRALLTTHGFGDITIKGAFNPAGIAVSLGSLPHRAEGLIVREGLGWHALVATASALMPLDLLSGAPGMIDFCARYAAGES
jgi:SAM-dependent methyltransferase